MLLFCVYLLLKGVGILSRVHKSLELRLVRMSQFKCPSSIIISGPSQYGKTTFTRQILQHADCLFERPIRKIVYCYGQWQDCLKKWQRKSRLWRVFPTTFPPYFIKEAKILIADICVRISYVPTLPDTERISRSSVRVIKSPG